VGITQPCLQLRGYNSCCLSAGVSEVVPATAPASEPKIVLVAVSGADAAEHKCNFSELDSQYSYFVY